MESFWRQGKEAKIRDMTNGFQILSETLLKAGGFETLPSPQTLLYIVQTKPTQIKHKSLQNQALTKIPKTVILTKPVHVPNKRMTHLCTKSVPYVCPNILQLTVTYRPNSLNSFASGRNCQRM